MPLSEQEKAALSTRRGRLAAHIPDSGERRNFIAQQGKLDASKANDSQYAQLSNQTHDTEVRQVIAGSFEHGGTVPHDGVYQLHEGEQVVPRTKVMAKHKKEKHHTHVEHHADGSHSVKHLDKDMKETSSHAVADDAGLMQHMQDSLGQGQAPQAAAPEAAPAPEMAAAPPAA